MNTLRCVLCDMVDEGRWWHPAHNRIAWSDPSLRPWLARVHGLTLAPGSNLRTGPWIPLRDEVRADE